MPLRNKLFGVFKVMTIKDSNGDLKVTLATSASQNRTMKVDQKNYIQGTAESRILDIGTLSETIDIEAPILIGPASALDGRTLLNTQIKQAATVTSQVLPILSSAKISIDATSGGTVSLQLKSDGQKSDVFQVKDGSPPAELDPLVAGPSRVAKNYDFQVVFGPYVAYVQKATISVDVQTEETVFLATGDSNAPDAAFMGTQYPFLGVSGIKVSGEGTAAVITSVSPGDGQNDPQDPSTQDLTIQTGGQVNKTTNDFQLNVFDGNGGVINLFVYEGKPLVDLSKAAITSTNFQVGTGILTVNFGFTAWVKIDTT